VVPVCGTLPIALLSIKLSYSRVVTKMPQIGVCGASARSFVETGVRMRSEDENSLQEKIGANELGA